MKGYADYGIDRGIVFCHDAYLRDFDSGWFRAIAARLFSYYQFQYGYAYTKAFKKGPAYFPAGMTTSGYASQAEREQTNRWFRRLSAVTVDNTASFRNMLRDVFPINFLSGDHLRRNMGSRTLKEWINSNPTHGTLTNLNEEIWVWEIEKRQIAAIREAMTRENMLIAYDLSI
ncbi:MAG: hypothetical protein M1283_06490 [Gammaproteobacteria bacterium]|nr:hypothetical protein [Gammaproteobacteria bacterium]